jgi:predicted signal transduction protein with EAL and GGDEF domain
MKGQGRGVGRGSQQWPSRWRSSSVSAPPLRTKSFVMAMHDDPSDGAIVRSVIDLARNLRIRVVSEGVEDPVVSAALGGAGCDLGQGYLFSRPLPAVAFGDWLRSRSAVAAGNVLPLPVAAAR